MADLARRVETWADAAWRHRGRRSLMAYTQATMASYERTWYGELLASYLDRMRLGEILRMLVFLPPQHGKSELISRRWPAHLLGNQPDAKVIATSYGDDLASFNARWVKRIMRSPAHRKIFGAQETRERRLDKLGAAADQVSFFEMPGHEGYLLSAGIQGPMTGFGGDYLIIDDPYRNAQAADSDAIRKSIELAYHAVIETRGRGLAFDGKGERMLGVFTRWRHDDLAGHILGMAKETGEDWVVLELPAILEKPPKDYDPRRMGESLWPSRYPAAKLLKRKKGMPLRTWLAMYQQVPAVEGGTIFKSKWWQYYDPGDVALWLADGSFDEMWQSWDMSFKKTGTSRVCGLLFARRGANIYVLDCVVDWMGFNESCDAVTDLSAAWPSAYTKVVEDKANGPAVMDRLRAKIGGLTAWPPEGEAMSAKVERWNAATPPCRSKNVYLPPKEVAPWVEGFTAELESCPTGELDDQADAFAQGIDYHLRGGSDWLDRMDRAGRDGGG